MPSKTTTIPPPPMDGDPRVTAVQHAIKELLKALRPYSKEQQMDVVASCMCLGAAGFLREGLPSMLYGRSVNFIDQQPTAPACRDGRPRCAESAEHLWGLGSGSGR